jgi:hypothetical protein
MLRNGIVMKKEIMSRITLRASLCVFLAIVSVSCGRLSDRPAPVLAKRAADRQQQNTTKQNWKFFYHCHFRVLSDDRPNRKVALADFKKAIELDPENADFHGNRAKVYRKLKKLPLAIVV